MHALGRMHANVRRLLQKCFSSLHRTCEKNDKVTYLMVASPLRVKRRFGLNSALGAKIVTSDSQNAYSVISYEYSVISSDFKISAL